MDVAYIEPSLGALLEIFLDHRTIRRQVAEFTDLLHRDGVRVSRVQLALNKHRILGSSV
jgi:hypothetical protein